MVYALKALPPFGPALNIFRSVQDNSVQQFEYCYRQGSSQVPVKGSHLVRLHKCKLAHHQRDLKRRNNLTNGFLFTDTSSHPGEALLNILAHLNYEKRSSYRSEDIQFTRQLAIQAPIIILYSKYLLRAS
jgi:hypothetical protein